MFSSLQTVNDLSDKLKKGGRQKLNLAREAESDRVAFRMARWKLSKREGEWSRRLVIGGKFLTWKGLQSLRG